MSIENVRVCAGAIASTLRFEGFPIIAEEFEALVAGLDDHGANGPALQALIAKGDLAALGDVRIRSMPLPAWWRWLANLRQSCEDELRLRSERSAKPRPTSVVEVPRRKIDRRDHGGSVALQANVHFDIDAARDDRRLMAAGGMMLVSTTSYSVAVFTMALPQGQHALLVLSGVAALAASLLTGMSVFGRRRRGQALPAD
jgi:hypothetical protein